MLAFDDPAIPEPVRSTKPPSPALWKAGRLQAAGGHSNVAREKAGQHS